MKIIYTNPDGSTSILTPDDKYQLSDIFPEVEEMTDDEYINFIRVKYIPQEATNVRVINSSDIPQDRSFRAALKTDLTFDIDKCVEITKNRLRNERAPLLAELDAENIRALEDGSLTIDIIAEKKRLRDITLIPNNKMTLDDLKAIKAVRVKKNDKSK